MLFFVKRFDVMVNGVGKKYYDVSYRDFHTGEMKKIRRSIPKKIHDIIPEDTVKLKYKRNDDWLAGEEFKVKHVSYKNPNILQIINDDDMTTTFVSSYDVNLERVGERDEVRSKNDSIRRKEYLRWP